MSTIPENDETATVQAASIPFVMIPNELVDANPSPQALAAYAHLRRFADWSSGEVEFRLQLLAERLGYSRRQSVLPYLEELVTLGFLEVREQHGANGQRLRNAYTLVTPVRSSARPPFALPHGARALERTTSTDPLRTDPLRTSGRGRAKAKPEEPALIPELEKPADELLRVIAEERARATKRPVSKRKPSPRARAAAGRLAADVDAARLLTVLRWAFDPAGAGDPWWLDHLVNAEDVERQWDRLEARCSAAIRAATTPGAAAPQSDHQAMLAAIGWSAWDWETATPEERAGMRENALQNGWRPTRAEAPASASR